MVEILTLSEETFQITFPVKDYLVVGMKANLEFHEAEGYLECPVEVLQDPASKYNRVLLSRSADSFWNAHRSSNRVNTDLTVQVRDQQHPRRYDASLVNLSSGGVLIQTSAPLDVPARVELCLSLPGESQQMVEGRILHVNTLDDNGESGICFFGVKFTKLPEETYNAIAGYIAQLLSEHAT